MDPQRNSSQMPSWLANQSLSGVPEGGTMSQSLALLAMLLMDVLAVAGNTAVMLVIARTPQLRKFVFVFHLCLVDLLAALVLMPLGMMGVMSGSSRTFLGSEVLCRSYLFLSVCLVSAAILSICAINVERYYYVLHPMRYEVRMTLGLVGGVLGGIWMKALLMSVLPLLAWVLQGGRGHMLEPGVSGVDGGGVTIPASHPPAHTHRRCSLHWSGGGANRVAFMVLFALVYFLCPLLLILVVYCSMFKVARVAAMQHGPMPTWTETLRRRRSESLSSRSTMVTSSGSGSRSDSTTGTGTGACGTPQRPFGGGKAAAILAAMGGQFLFCWLPYFSFHLYSALASLQPASLAPLEDVVTWIGYLCFTSNPFFYGCLNRQIRQELSKHLPFLFRPPAGDEQEHLPSRDGSIQENFMQFLQGTGCNLENPDSQNVSSPKSAPLRPPPPLPRSQPIPIDFRIPGQIAEETSEFLEQHQIKNNLIIPDS
ncbi:G-protein coupled receptor 61-like [Pygocentrus nattereri]|uniref:G-protein coupled receptors family 1 profile domain-containing protein n=1 Tax=Pygocentrus nattereri TaxID=42514 RepID=A0A3B4D3Q5_PYGNA|nr:G-protein coupled receptor 61-like [Pygocentrus nattereri]